MTEKQLRLFAPPKPLFETFGSDYFRKLPKSPAVYRMYDQQGRLIYVGQSKNLRQRLNSYRYVHPDRSSRKLVRLVHSIATIEYELCDSETAAKLRENELLRQFRPRFNSLNTWPKAHCFIGMHWEPEQLTLSFTRETPGQTENYFGAFKSGCLQGYMALLRLLWILGRKSDDAWSNLPRQLVAPKATPHFALEKRSLEIVFSSHSAKDCLGSFLAGESPFLVDVIRPQLAMNSGSRFYTSLMQTDLDLIERFYRYGPQRNAAFRRKHGITEALIGQETLDDLIVGK